MIYPNGRILGIDYSGALHTRISRPSFLDDAGTHLEEYSYLGLSTAVERNRPQPNVNLTYVRQGTEGVGDAGDQYTGLDRFGRVVDQRWLRLSEWQASDPAAGHRDRLRYGYDRDSDRMFRENVINSVFSELYHVNGAAGAYDQFNQLTEFRRGALSDTNEDGVPDTVVTAIRSQGWTLDAQGNWLGVTTEAGSRVHNRQNQITSIFDGTPSQIAPTYDNNGNMTTDETGKTYKYDAWNRLAQVNAGATTYRHDALGRRVTENSGTLRELFYSAARQVLEERVGGSTQAQYVWSLVYVDALVLRDRGSERLYVQQDANYNVTALLNSTGAVQERFVYDPYGKATVYTAAWAEIPAGTALAWVYLHQGGRFDAATGLYYFRTREYSPTLGRWMQQDPIGFGAGDNNLYRAIGNSPVTGLDPSGLFVETAATATAGVALGTIGLVVAVVVAAPVVAYYGYQLGTAIAPYTSEPLAEALYRWWNAEQLEYGSSH